MYQGRTTLAKFIIEEQRRYPNATGEFSALLNDVVTACKTIALSVGRGALAGAQGDAEGVNVHGERQKKLDLLSNEIVLNHCEWDGHLAAMVSEEMDEVYQIPDVYPRGKYLLVFDPLDGSSNVDVNISVGTIFSILRVPERRAGTPRGGDATEEARIASAGNDGMASPSTGSQLRATAAGTASPSEGAPQDETATADIGQFLQPGAQQVCAGYAIYGPTTMLVLTLGRGVNGFTLDREAGEFILTHAGMTIPTQAREFAINASNERFWEPPVKRYVAECLAGRTGPREADFNMRWIASLVAEVHRILVRGGLFLYPRDTRDLSKAGRLRLLYEANPMAMIVEQAGGAASTGRERILDMRPTELHQRVPVILGSRDEVQRLVRYHREHDEGSDLPYTSPLFNTRSLFMHIPG